MKDTFDAAGAGERLGKAIEARGLLLRDAAVGLPVTAQQFRAAEEHVRLCEQDAALASEIGKHAVAERDRSVIAEFAERADALAAQMSDRAEEHLAAARALDVAMDVARAAAGRLDQARQALSDTDRAGHAHNALLTEEARCNGILAAQHTSMWPKARTASALPAMFGLRVRPELVATTNGPRMTSTGPHDTVVHDSAEQIARASHTSLPKPVAAAA